MRDALLHPPARWLDLDRCRLPYWRIGHGPDLVFLHGWPLDARTWRHAVAALEDTFTCHLIDLPGAGRSVCSGAMSVRALGAVVVEAIEAMDLGARPLGLVAHDSGGTFARLAAAALPGRIRGLALGNTEIPGYHPPRLKLLLRALRSRLVARLLPPLLRARLGRRLIFRDAFADPSLIEGTFNDLFITPLAAGGPVFKASLAFAHHIQAEDFDILAEAHPDITAPVKLIWGAQDRFFPLRRCLPMRQSFGGPVDLVVLDDASLLVHEEAPDRFNAEVRAHFEACFQPPLPLLQTSPLPPSNHPDGDSKPETA